MACEKGNMSCLRLFYNGLLDALNLTALHEVRGRHHNTLNFWYRLMHLYASPIICSIQLLGQRKEAICAVQDSFKANCLSCLTPQLCLAAPSSLAQTPMGIFIHDPMPRLATNFLNHSRRPDLLGQIWNCFVGFVATTKVQGRESRHATMGYWVYFPEYRMNVDIINEFLGQIWPNTPVEDFSTRVRCTIFINPIGTSFWLELESWCTE